MINLKIYAEIVINSDALDIDKPFTYEIPEELQDDVRIGQWVKVPFGIKNSIVDGFILSVKEDEISKIKIKKIKSIVKKEPLINEDNLKLIDFLRKTLWQQFYLLLLHFYFQW